MTTHTMTRCEHLACLCEVEAAQGTCSSYCASPEGKDPQNILCKCGHALCEDEIERELHG
jgi:hypothetical protein